MRTLRIASSALSGVSASKSVRQPASHFSVMARRSSPSARNSESRCRSGFSPSVRERAQEAELGRRGRGRAPGVVAERGDGVPGRVVAFIYVALAHVAPTPVRVLVREQVGNPGPYLLLAFGQAEGA